MRDAAKTRSPLTDSRIQQLGLSGAFCPTAGINKNFYCISIYWYTYFAFYQQSKSCVYVYYMWYIEQGLQIHFLGFSRKSFLRFCRMKNCSSNLVSASFFRFRKNLPFWKVTLSKSKDKLHCNIQCTTVHRRLQGLSSNSDSLVTGTRW